MVLMTVDELRDAIKSKIGDYSTAQIKDKRTNEIFAEVIDKPSAPTDRTRRIKEMKAKVNKELQARAKVLKLV